jgi:uncharacterized protein YdaU (DUF1376 family)
MPTPKRQPAFQFYPTAWINSVSVETMPPEVEGTYIRLLCRQWIAGELPADPARLRLLSKLSAAQWKKAWPLLEEHFPLAESGTGRRNPTLASVQQERDDFKVQAAESGQRGAQKRWGATPDANSQPTKQRKDLPTEDDRKAVGYPTDTLPQPQWGTDSSVSVSVTVPPSPSPSGEGSSPAAATPLAVVEGWEGDRTAVLPGESLDAYRQRMERLASATPPLALIGHADARLAVVRFLDEQRILPARVQNWVRRIVGWTNGLGTSGMRAVSWDAVILGIEELLDTNPPGQSIRPQELLTFVESAQRRLTAPGGPARRTGPDADREREEAHKQVLIEYAQQGDSHAIAECERLGIDYRSVA